jgi:hypothetical protein
VDIKVFDIKIFVKYDEDMREEMEGTLSYLLN